MAYKDKKSRKAFFETWKGRGYEKGETQQFWLSLLTNVLGYEHNDTVLFEHHVSTGGFIDVWIRQSDVMIEQKSIDVDLDKPEVRQGETKTPLQQVIDYAASLPLTEQPKYLITCNFDTFRVYDRNQYGDRELPGKQFEFKLEDLVEHPEYLSCIVDPNNSRLRKEKEVSEQAGELVGKLYDMLLKQYDDPESAETQHSLNVLCVRLVFCLFCEDAELFGEPDAFCNYLAEVRPADIRIKLQHLFDNLDKPKENRDKYDTDIKAFPYVNGGLFREKVEIPPFTQEIKDFVIEKMAIPVNWANISPTIFGGIFESTLNPDTRRKGGMHYTSPENIHKVIDPLFLDDLKAEFDAIRTNEDLSLIKRKNRFRKFHEKLCSLVFFDPACGSGNFLTETYICLRQLEYATLREYKDKQVSAFNSAIEGERELRVKLDQFYGIEINDFAVSVAETALWISRLKANREYLLLLDLDEKDFPLSDRANVIRENALRFDWNDLVEPERVSYVIGNPPFKGAHAHPPRTAVQTEELKDAFQGANGIGEADYVAAWFAKAAEYLKSVNAGFAFVATSSITQGQQPALIWPYLFDRGWEISFAYRPFLWGSDSTTDTAAVAVTVIGANKNPPNKRILFETEYKSGEIISRREEANVNPYIVAGPNILIESRKKPLCDVPTIGIGNKPIDGGYYLFDEERKEDFLKIEPNAAPLFHAWLGSTEFINRKQRYVLWLGELSSTELDQLPECKKIVEAVYQYRLKSSSEGTRKLANKPTRFHVENIPQGTSILIPQTSSERRLYIPMGFVDAGVFCSNAVRLIPNANIYHFGVLQSITHNAWMRVVTGRMKNDYQYAGEIVYNSFPWPTPSYEQKALIEQTAQGILDAQALYPDRSLADLYDMDTMPVELKAAHDANDKAVMDAYGFDYSMPELEMVAELMKMYQELTAGEKK